jgi:glycosyltransferase involved in cell wall biosynthesis
MKILIVVYDFRESALAASYRARKIAKYALKDDHQVSVICAYSDNYLDQKINMHVVNSGKLGNQSLSSRLYMRLTQYPDPSAKWAHEVISYVNTFEEFFSGLDMVLVSSPPHAIQKVAVFFRKKFNIHVISDFRDDFITNHRTKWYTPFHYWYGVFLESKIFNAVNIIIANTENVRARFISRYPKLKDKVYTITNGYDEDDFSCIEVGEKNNKIKIAYVGDGYKDFVSSILSNACTKLDLNNMSEMFSFETAGNGLWVDHQKHSNWNHYGLVSQKAANEIIMRSDILLMIMPFGEKEPSGTIPLKTFGYLRSGKKILYYGEKGSVTDLMKEFDGVSVFSREQIEDLHIWLIENGRFLYNKNFSRPKIYEYNFESITRKILELANV